LRGDVLVLSLLVIFVSLFLYLSNRKNGNKQTNVVFLTIVFLESIRILFFFSKINFIFPLLLIFLTFYFYKDENFITQKRVGVNLDSRIHFLSRYYYHISFMILFGLFLLEWLVFDGAINENGYLIIIFSIILLLSGNIPENYQKEYDFIFLFIFLLLLFFVIPEVSYKIYTESYGLNSEGWIDNEKAVNIFLAVPLVNILDVLGFTASAEGDIIFYEDTVSQTFVGLKIAQSCSGIESTIIFISAFISYSIIDYKSYRLNIFPLTLVGILVAYLSNLLRMTVIIIVGHYYGGDALSWTHTNIGWIIFMIWVALFWLIMEKFVRSESLKVKNIY